MNLKIFHSSDVLTFKVKWVDIILVFEVKPGIFHTSQYLQLIVNELQMFISNTAHVSLMPICQKQLTPLVKWADQGDLGLCMDKVINSVHHINFK